MLRVGMFSSREQLMKAVAAGRCPRPAKAGNRLIWKRLEVLSWFEQNKIVIYRQDRPPAKGPRIVI